MIKYIEASDIHADERWIDTTLNCLDKIIETAKKEKVDFVAFPGDMHNKNFYLTKAYNQLREKIKELIKICPVCAVVGTPGHENEEMYKPLEDIGLVLLRPDNVYGYNNIFDCGNIQKLNQSIEENSDCIIFGVSELTTKNILAKTKLTSEQANKKAVDLFEKYIDEYVAPMRLKYNDIPAIMLFHGEVSDSLQENSNDIITKCSNIVIHTEILERAGLDRLSLGHRHIPWESEKICAGYAGYCGIDDRPWNYLDFIPGMNLITINHSDNIVLNDSISYGTPERRKITKSLDFYNPEIAYWLVTNNPNDKYPAGHPWSRITYDEKRIKTQRITEEQAAKITCLTDLFKLIDPTVSSDVCKKVKTITEYIPELSLKPINFKLMGIEIAGCTLFGSKTLKWNLGESPTGLNSLMGDNGSGKSSTVAFCHPYPCIIGKDTNSGRSSAIKDFFDQPVSYIKKWVVINKIEHIHNIQIQGAHTKNPKVICSLIVGGFPVLEKGAFDEMHNKCEELYGSFQDYMLTSFYVQPLQSRHGTSGLMMANMTDIRDLVQSIAGVDRDSEKKYALDKVKEINQEITNTENWLNGAEQFDINIKPIEMEIENLLFELNKKNNEQQNLKNQFSKSEIIRNKLQEEKIKNDIAKNRKNNDTKIFLEIIENINNKNERIEKIKLQMKRKKEIESKLAVDAEQQKLEKKQIKEQRKYERLLSEYRIENTKFTNEIRKLDTRSMVIADKIRILEKICPQCGYIDPENKIQIDKLQSELATIPAKLKKRKCIIENLIEPKMPEKFNLTKILTDSKRVELQNILNEINSSDKLIAEIETNITELKFEQKILKTQIYNIDNTIESKLIEINKNIIALSHHRNELLQAVSILETQIKNKQESIEKAKKIKDQIKNKRQSLKLFNLDLIDWKYIASMLQSDKIPALELSLITDSIDAEANRLISEYETGRFTFRTITQDVSKKGLKDIFDIKIYDSEIGEERSFLKYSVGQKAFFNDAYVKALIRKRNERTQKNYSPIISDEADAPIQPHRIQEYYEMQKKYFDGKSNQVIVISHAPDTHNYIQNNINVKELICNQK